MTIFFLSLSEDGIFGGIGKRASTFRMAVAKQKQSFAVATAKQKRKFPLQVSGCAAKAQLSNYENGLQKLLSECQNAR